MYTCDDVSEAQVIAVDVLLPYAIPIGSLCLMISIYFLIFMHEMVSLVESELSEEADPRNTHSDLTGISYFQHGRRSSDTLMRTHFMKCRR